ncbi:MAG: ABC transporter substrate binding protein, partial [Syntrophobacteraceae bacterium]
RDKEIDLIIALDDPAVDMLTDFHTELFPGVPVVFAGITHFRKYAARGRKEITGVYETQDIVDTIDTALRLFPDAKELLNVSDATIAGISARKELEAIAPRYAGRLNIRYLPACTHEEARAAVAAFPANSIILLNSYATDSAGKTLSTQASTLLLTSAAHAPVFGVHRNRLGDGIVGGCLLSGREHGRRAADMALRVLAGEAPETMEIRENGSSRQMFDYNQLERFHISPSELPEGSIVINEPKSVFETHREFAVTVISILILLTITALLLAFFIVRLLQARTALRKKTDELDRVFNLSLDLLCISDRDGRFLRLNPAWENTLGYSLDELEGAIFTDFVHPEDLDATRQAVSEVIAGKTIFDFTNRWRRKDGAYRWIEWRTTPHHGLLFYSVARDITGRKQAEEALRFTQYAIDNANDQAFWMTGDGSIIYVNDAACRSLGYSREELLNLSILDIEVAHPREVFPAHWRDLREHGRLAVEGMHRAKDGSVHPVEIHTNFVSFDGKEYNCAFITDITERKWMEQSLRESEGFLRALLQSAPVMIWLKDPKGIYLACNAMFERFFAVREKELIGKTDYDIVDKDLADFFRERDRMAMDAGNPVTNEEWIVSAEDGRRVLLETIKTPMIDDRGVLIGVLGVARDITERNKAEEERAKLSNQLQHAQKIESVGRLAGGVAHDFNNMLSVILGYGELALRRTSPGMELHGNLLEIMKAARRSAEIARQLLAFARKQTISPKVLDINETIAGMTKMLQRLIGEDIDLAWLPGEAVWPVMIDPGQIDQILVNLCVNARDAIADVGKVTIETGNVEFDEAYCSQHHGFMPGEYVVLAVSDNGCGMDAETLGKIFEPFFTTKEIGKGTGLGLPTVYGIVKQNNGFVNVYSEPGQGTSFRIYFPRQIMEAGASPEKPKERLPASGHETILLVEDEPAILEMTTKMLKKLGYTVLPARKPSDAIELARTYENEIHLLMTDVVMPEMNGRDLAQGMLSIHSDLRCLFMSGYTANVIAHHGVLDEGVHFIQKPFSMDQLGTKVREALGAAEA